MIMISCVIIQSILPYTSCDCFWNDNLCLCWFSYLSHFFHCVDHLIISPPPCSTIFHDPHHHYKSKEKCFITQSRVLRNLHTVLRNFWSSNHQFPNNNLPVWRHFWSFDHQIQPHSTINNYPHPVWRDASKSVFTQKESRPVKKLMRKSSSSL